MVTVSENVFYNTTSDGSTQNIKAGEEMSVKDILYCALVTSANEACNIIAEYVCGDIETFITKMNEKAKSLGCTGTHFANTHGLPDENHYTTAQDLCKIYTAAYSYPLFSEVAGTAKYNTAPTNFSSVRRLENTNQLLNSDGKYYYESCTGGKTGHTDAAGFCLVSSAEENGLKLISVVMGTVSETIEDGTVEVKSFTDTIKLFDYGFDNFGYRNILNEGDLITEIGVLLGDGTDSVIAELASPITAFLPNDADTSTSTYDIEIFDADADGNLTAPIEKKQVIGKLTLTFNGKTYDSVDLIANHNVKLQKMEFVKDEIDELLSSKWLKIIAAIIIVIFIAYIVLVVRYNRKRRKKYKAEVEAAQSRLSNMQKTPTTGASFEAIEEQYKTYEKEKAHK